MSGARCSGTINDEYGHQMTVTDIERLLLTIESMQARIDSLESKIGGQQFGSDLSPDTNLSLVEGGGGGTDAESIWTVPIDQSTIVAGNDDRPLIYNDTFARFRVASNMVVNSIHLDDDSSDDNAWGYDGFSEPYFNMTYGAGTEETKISAGGIRLLSDYGVAYIENAVTSLQAGGFYGTHYIDSIAYESDFGFGRLILEEPDGRTLRIILRDLPVGTNIASRQVEYKDHAGTNRTAYFFCSNPV